MYTVTQHAPHTNRDRFWATKRNPNIDIQTIHPLSLGICSPAWAPNLAITRHNTLQTIQNNALQIITGCTQTTPTNHIHYKAQVLTLQNHINMRGTQFLAAASTNQDLPCHYMLAHQPTPRSNETTPQALYTGFLNTIPQHSSSHIHMHFTNLAIQKLSPNTILGTLPPEIHQSELTLPRADWVHLSRLRCGHHTALATYQKRIDYSIDKVCTHCSTGTHSLTQIMTHCPALTHIRTHHNISSPLDLWHSPGNCLLFFRGAGLLGQTC